MSAPTESSLEGQVDDLIALVVAGKGLQAFDKYYSEDVVMQENDGPLREGKPAARAFEVDFLSKVTSLREYACAGRIVSGDRAFVVWRIDLDHADWGTVKMSEVAVQQWREGQIIREKFVYG